MAFELVLDRPGIPAETQHESAQPLERFEGDLVEAQSESILGDVDHRAPQAQELSFVPRLAQEEPARPTGREGTRIPHEGPAEGEIDELDGDPRSVLPLEVNLQGGWNARERAPFGVRHGSSFGRFPRVPGRNPVRPAGTSRAAKTFPWESVRLRRLPGPGTNGAGRPPFPGFRDSFRLIPMSSNPEDKPFSESHLDSPEYRRRLLRKLNTLIAVLEVARAKVLRSLEGPNADVERLTRIQKNLGDTLRVCLRAKLALERCDKLPADLPAQLAQATSSAVIPAHEPMSARLGVLVELSSAAEAEKFHKLGPIDPREIRTCDLDVLCQRLLEL